MFSVFVQVFFYNVFIEFIVTNYGIKHVGFALHGGLVRALRGDERTGACRAW